MHAQWYPKSRAYEIHYSCKISFLNNENYGREIDLEAGTRFLRVFFFFKSIYAHSDVREHKISPLVREIKIVLAADGKL